MKVLLINGSPHKEGCTYTALTEVAKELNANGIETEIFHIGTDSVRGCIGCGACVKLGKCAFDDDIVNKLASKVREADGYVFGSPVHYAAISGAMSCVMDRLFYSSGSAMRFKPAAGVCSARRAGTTAAYDQFNKYFGINRMISVPSQYWNMVHGAKAEDVKKDEEGLQIMRTIGMNMAWMLKVLDSAKQNGIEIPEQEAGIKTNFITD